MIEVRHLRYFVAVAEEMHFGRAAERLHMAQSPLSHQIRQLERHLGTVLLDRDHHVVGLTDAGATFLEEARNLLAGLDRAADRTRQAAIGAVGRLVVGYVAETATELLPRILASHRRRHPGVELDLCQGTTGHLLEYLRRGSLHVCFVRAPGPAGDLSYRPLLREELLLAGTEELGTPGRPADLSEHTGAPFVLPARRFAAGLREDIEEALAAENVEPSAVHDVRSPTAALLLVATGAGLSLVPAGTVRSYPVSGTVCRRLVTPATTSCGVCWRRDESSPVVANFLDSVRGDTGPIRPVTAAPAG